MDGPISDGFDMLDEDFMGELLHLLTTEDIRSARLCCKGWYCSLQSRIRVLHPAFIADAAPKYPLSSLEVLQLPLVRPVQQHLQHLPPSLHTGQTTDPATESTAAESAAETAVAGTTQAFTSLAPLRSLSAAGLQGMAHASVLNLSGQQLPYNVLKLLSQHMKRLKSLQLDYCRLPATALLHATGLTSLLSLSLAGIHLQGGLHQHVKDTAAAATATAAGPGAFVAAAAAAADHVEQDAPSRQQAAFSLKIPTVLNAWAAKQQMQVATSWHLGHAPSTLLGWSSSRFAAMTVADHGLLLDAVLLPQLQRLNLDMPAKPLVRFCAALDSSSRSSGRMHEDVLWLLLLRLLCCLIVL
jgi:hypothetical protein